MRDFLLLLELFLFLAATTLLQDAVDFLLVHCDAVLLAQLRLPHLALPLTLGHILDLYSLASVKEQTWLVVVQIVELQDVLLEGVFRLVSLGVLHDHSASDSRESLLYLVVEGNFFGKSEDSLLGDLCSRC